MDFLRIVSPIYRENCYVLSTAAKAAIVIDPGAQTFDRIKASLAELNAELAAIILTHGHADHIWDAAKVSSLNPQAPVYLATPDHFWLEPPGPEVQLGIASDFSNLEGGWHPLKVQAPPDELFSEGGAELVAGLSLRALPAPGHSPGCTMFFGVASLADNHGLKLGFDGQEGQNFCFSGDVVFKGTIGRTDLPHADGEVMKETLRTLRYTINPDTILLPGHGLSTTWEEELETNPFLHDLGKMGE